jgi:hypothetical protein
MSVYLFINKLYTVNIQKGQMQKLAGLLTENEIEELDLKKLAATAGIVGSTLATPNTAAAQQSSHIPHSQMTATVATNKQLPSSAEELSSDPQQAGKQVLGLYARNQPGLEVWSNGENRSHEERSLAKLLKAAEKVGLSSGEQSVDMEHLQKKIGQAFLSHKEAATAVIQALQADPKTVRMMELAGV